MAVESKPITPRLFLKTTKPALGLRISKPWLGYANALFLELGTLHYEALPRLPSLKHLRVRTKSLKGQAEVMIDSDWRVEKHERFLFGRDSREGRVREGIGTLRGRRLNRINLNPCGPELFLELEGGYHLHSFSTHSAPCWAIFLRDPDLFPRNRRWFEFDHSLLVTFDEVLGKLAKNMCYGPKPGPT